MRTRPRLVYLVTSSVSVKHLRGQLAFMRRQGFEVYLVSSPGVELQRAAAEEGVRTLEVPMEREIRPGKDCLALYRLVKLWRSLRPDCIVAGTPKAGLLGMLSAWLTRVPGRVYLLHGLRLETARGLKRLVLYLAERTSAACARRVVCVSESLRERYVQLRLAPAEKTTVPAMGSANGIDADRFQATAELRDKAAKERSELGIPRDAPVVGFVGRLTRDKGIVELLAAFKRVLAKIPNARLLLVGELEQGDPLPEECVSQLAAHPQVAFSGYVDDPSPYYQLMDVLAFPSHREGLGMAPLEAAAAGLPVAGFRATGTVTAVVDGVTGTLVPVGDEESLGEAILRYLESPELRQKHGQAGRDRVQRDFRPEMVWKAFHQEYVALMQKPGSMTKRLFDLAAAALALLLLLPLLGIIALAVLLTVGRPILFRQRRPGLHGRPFTIYKFRTMLDPSDNQGRPAPDTDRLTRLGRFLRRTSLDELPELFNVLRGEMSLIGPRPLLMQYLDRYTPEQARRHEVRPGITGWAQVNGRNAISWEEKFRLDVWYVDHASLWLDFRILIMTVWQVLRPRGVNAGRDVTMPEFTGSSHIEATCTASKESRYRQREDSRPSRVYLSPPHMSQDSRELLLEAFDSNWIAPLGPQLDAFEREFARKIGVEHAVALSSGTAALHLALLLSGVGPGDEVATATLTFAATANAIRYVGATPVFLDSQPGTWNLDPQLLAEELEAGVRRGRPLKAVVAVDLFGQCADYQPICELCRSYEIPLIEDAAEALGATYRGQAAGTFGRFGCFSFNGNKIITTSSGGMLVTECKALADRARFLASQARRPCIEYEHPELGYNYRMSNLLAAVGRGQLRVLDERVQKRRANFQFYRQALGDLPGIAFMPEHPDGRSTRWLTCITVDPQQFGATREDLRLALERENIESRPVWKPMHLQPLYAGCRSRGGEVAEGLFRHGLCLPSGSNLSEDDLRRIVQIIRAVAGRRAATGSRDEPSYVTVSSTGDGESRSNKPCQS